MVLFTYWPELHTCSAVWRRGCLFLLISHLLISTDSRLLCGKPLQRVELREVKTRSQKILIEVCDLKKHIQTAPKGPAHARHRSKKLQQASTLSESALAHAVAWNSTNGGSVSWWWLLSESTYHGNMGVVEKSVEPAYGMADLLQWR
jgi:hypothetical protein